MTERYFEDFAVGQRFETGTYTLERQELFEFAREYDPQPFHLNVEAASRSVFRGLAASGWHTAALTIKLLVESDLNIAGGIVGRVIEVLEWPQPVRAGDTLTVRSEVLDVSNSRSRPGGQGTHAQRNGESERRRGPENDGIAPGPEPLIRCRFWISIIPPGASSPSARAVPAPRG